MIFFVKLPKETLTLWDGLLIIDLSYPANVFITGFFCLFELQTCPILNPHKVKRLFFKL